VPKASPIIAQLSPIQLQKPADLIMRQIRSLLSLISFLGSGRYNERFVGVKIPRTNIEEHHLEDARRFAGKLVEQKSDVTRSR